MPAIRAVIFDLDGVVRHFDSCDAIEHRHGLPLGAVEGAAFKPSLMTAITTGRITHEQWIVTTADELARRYGQAARAAAEDFAVLPAHVDPEVIALARELAAASITTAILTNGTTRVESECEALGIMSMFDHFFNSARIGYAKPDRRVFEHAVDTLGFEPSECAFTDDSEMKLAGAIEIGMATQHYVGVAPLRLWLRDLGLGVALPP